MPGGVIEGIVRDEQTRQPVAGASIDAQTRDAPAMLLGETARRHADRRPRRAVPIAGLRPGGSYALEARAQAQSHVLRTRRRSSASASRSRSPTSRSSSARAARFAESSSTRQARRWPGSRSRRSAQPDRETEQPSDAKGASSSSPGCRASGHIDLMGGGNDYLAAEHDAHVEVTTTDVDGVKVKVRRGGKVAGHVEPRQICEVRLDFDEAALGPAELPILVAPLTTGPDGVFAFESASPIPYVLAARCPSGDQGTQPVRITPDMAELVLPVKTAGASIAGRVVYGSGKPVAAAIVMATPMTGSERTTIMNGVILGGAQARSAADGAFELRGLTAATYRLRVLDHSRPVPMKSPEAAARIVLAETDHKTGVELAIDRPDGAIRGTVTGADGQPIADAWVSVQQGLDDMLAGLSDQDHEGESRTVRIESRSDDDGAGAIAPVLTDATGHFEIADLPRVSWTVIAEAQAGKLRGRAVHVTPDATITIQAGEHHGPPRDDPRGRRSTGDLRRHARGRRAGRADLRVASRRILVRSRRSGRVHGARDVERRERRGRGDGRRRSIGERRHHAGRERDRDRQGHRRVGQATRRHRHGHESPTAAVHPSASRPQRATADDAARRHVPARDQGRTAHRARDGLAATGDEARRGRPGRQDRGCRHAGRAGRGIREFWAATTPVIRFFADGQPQASPSGVCGRGARTDPRLGVRLGLVHRAHRRPDLSTMGVPTVQASR